MIVRAALSLALVAVFGCTGGGQGSQPATTGTAAMNPSAAAPQPVELAPSGSLEPGSYVTTSFRPPVRFSVGSGWDVVSASADDWFTVARGYDPADPPLSSRLLTFARVEQVLDSPFLTAQEVMTRKDAHARPSPDDLLGWLLATPYTESSAPRPVTIGGVAGVEVDQTVGPFGPEVPAGADSPCDPRRCLTLVSLAGPAFLVVPEGPFRLRWWLLTVGGTRLLISAGAPAETFAEFLADVEPLVESVRFD